MRLAVVVGGWHWPLHPFERIAAQSSGADLFVVGHRSPELPIVREEKRDILADASGPLADLDRELYARFPDVSDLRALGWHYHEAPNTVGDWGFFNQWLEMYDYRQYDVILNCHDDTYIRRQDLFDHIQERGDWLVLANGTYRQAPEAYVRGSFEFWRREMLDLIGGRFDLGPVGMTREGKTDSPADMGTLSEWNATGDPLRRFIVSSSLSHRMKYLSPHYRISPWVIEGERGFLHWNNGAPWSYSEGLAAAGLIAR